MEDLESRFWSKVDIHGPVPTHKPDLGPCWLWLAGTTAGGYGYFWLDGSMRPAHRVAWQMAHGPVAGRLHVDHLCRNIRCVNPAHLEPVTRKTNILRGLAPQAINARKTHCVKGHEFTPENTIIRQRVDGGLGRACRVCTREGNKRRVARWRERHGLGAK